MKPPHATTAAAIALAAFAGACGGVRVNPEDASTRLTVGDMRAIVDDTIQALAASDWVADRTPDSPPAVISFQEMVNASDDVITRSELAYLAQSVANAALSDRTLREQKNITLVIPADRLRDTRRSGTRPNQTTERNVTHTMTAVIDNLARQNTDERTDFYIASYQLLRTHDGAIVWTADVSFERKALGRSFN